jgi:hypothetical protein
MRCVKTNPDLNRTLPCCKNAQHAGCRGPRSITSVRAASRLSYSLTLDCSVRLFLAFRPITSGVRRSCKRLLNRWAGLGRNVKFSKLGAYLEDVDAGGVEDLFGRWDGDSEVCVFGQAGDEEHEAAGFDLHFSEVCAAGGDVGVFAVGGLSV